MKPKWYSIDPTLTTDGAFAALSSFKNAKELKPVPREETESFYDGADFVIDSKFVTSRVEAEISYGAFFDGKIDSESRLYVYDFSFFKTVTSDEPLGDLIISTRYGVSLRIGLQLKKLKIDVNADFLAIAAAVALGKTEAYYRIEAIGLGDALSVVANELPVSGKFDFDSYGKIAGIGTKMLKWINDNKDKLGVSPIQIGVVIPFEDIIAESSQSIYYAMRKIHKGTKLSEALKSMPIQLNSDVIKETYKGITRRDDPEYKIQEFDQSLAKKWLDFEDV
jgi:hypothetical protein